MAFLLRTISHSAEGREIVRTSKVDDDLLKAGRDPDCDIRLNDLAVALHHATLERVSASRIGISAEMGMTVEIDGQTARDGQIDLATGGTVKIGPFLLRILAKEIGSEDVAIDIQRADAAGEDDRFDTGRFALQTVMPGKRATAWSLVAAVLALFLAWPIWSFYQNRTEAARYAQGYHADRLWLSGSLSQGHASLAENCQACHVEPFVAVRDQACTSCHSAIHDHARPELMRAANPNLTGFRRLRQSFGALFGQDPGRCVDCHTEHEGPSRIPPTPQQFCADCHADIGARLPGTTLGSAGDFGTDHPEFRPLVLIGWTGDRPRRERVRLDRRPREMSNLIFPHALHLDPDGGAARMGQRLASRHGFGRQLVCADCHVPTPDGVGFRPPQMERNCGMCHSLSFEELGTTMRTLRHGPADQVIADIRAFYRAGGPQRPSELSAGARERPGDVTQLRATLQDATARSNIGARAERTIHAVFTGRRGTCAQCHQVVRPPPGSLAYRIRPVRLQSRYLQTGWFDHGPHRVLQPPGRPRQDGPAACLGCHRADASGDSADLLLPGLAGCRVCHTGEARGWRPGQRRTPVASGCAMCHDYHMDEGTPAELLRQRVRGRRWETTVIPAQPPPAVRRR